MTYAFKYANIKGKNPYKVDSLYKSLYKIECLYNEYKKTKITQKDINITGKELIELGFNNKKIKPIMELLLEYVYLNPEKNNKLDLIEYSKKIEKQVKKQ